MDEGVQRPLQHRLQINEDGVRAATLHNELRGTPLRQGLSQSREDRAVNDARVRKAGLAAGGTVATAVDALLGIRL